MGQCGCGGFTPQYQFPGPKGLTYAIQISPPCSDCLTPVGVIVYRLSQTEVTMMATKDLPLLPFHGETFGEAALPIVYPEQVLKEMRSEGWSIEEDLGDDMMSVAIKQAMDHQGREV